MEFKVGKMYWLRNRKQKAKVLDIDLDATGIEAIAVRVFSEEKNMTSFVVARNINGGVCDDEETRYDLMEEVTEPLKISQTWWVNVYKYVPINTNKAPYLCISNPHSDEEAAKKIGKQSPSYLDTVPVKIDYTEKV